MKLTNVNQVNDFKEAVQKCAGEVWLKGTDGSLFNLKSDLSQYVALGALLGEAGDSLELFCALKEDEKHFFDFFNKHEGVL